MGRMVAYAVKVPPEVAQRVRAYCGRKGLKQGHFVAEAVAEKIERDEELGDVKDLVALRGQEQKAVPYREYLRRRGR